MELVKRDGFLHEVAFNFRDGVSNRLENFVVDGVVKFLLLGEQFGVETPSEVGYGVPIRV